MGTAFSQAVAAVREYGGTSAVLQFQGTWMLLVTGGGPTPGKPTVTFAAPQDPDPLDRPLQVLLGAPEFDISDDSFQEMLATGALRTMRDPELRSAILAYYRTAEDMGGNVMADQADVDTIRRSYSNRLWQWKTR